MGTLIISGTLRANQFWPGGRSDADTASVDIKVNDAKSFVFIDDAGRRHATKAFANAEIIGQHGRSPVIKTSKKTKVSHVTIRLQGLDAPELHYQPEIPGSKGKGVTHPFRQFMGETCASALHDFVGALKEAEIQCEVNSVVKNPSDVCDVFGRVVGNIVLIRGGSRIDVNHWLLREGWAFPALYNSMSKAEINAVLADYEAAKQNKRGLFSHNLVTSALAPFDPTRVERKGPPSFQPFSDQGPVNFPKVFRRQAEHHASLAGGLNVPATLPAFIATKATDLALETDKFLKLKGSTIGKKPRPEFKKLATFLAGNNYPTGPDLVYWENESTLVKAGTKTAIKTW